jgi:transposase
VDTSDENISIDSLGRRSGPRRQHSLEEKRRIVEETHVRGASVASVARRHGLNANQVFAWRRLERQGLLDSKTTEPTAAMLPVTVSTPTVMPSEKAARARTEAKSRERGGKLIEIKLANGHSILLRGRVHARSLARVIDLLLRR